MPITTPLTDTHCHLSSPHFTGRVGEILARATAAGVGTIIAPGWDRQSAVGACALAAAYPLVRAAVGLHPWFVAKNPDTSWVANLLDDPYVVAVGEIGVDGDIDGYDPAAQDAAFRAQLRLAADRDLPVLLHARRGWDHLLACLRDIPVRGVVHAFSGSREIMEHCLKLGLYLSFSGMVTRPNSRRAREAGARVPADRLLLETDAPYMAMEGVPSEHMEPARLPAVLEALAVLRGDDTDTLTAQLATNVRTLFAPRWTT